LSDEDKQLEMTIEDWTLLSDHILNVVKDINAVIGYESDGLHNLKRRAIKRVVKGLREITLHYDSSLTTIREPETEPDANREKSVDSKGVKSMDNTHPRTHPYPSQEISDSSITTAKENGIMTKYECGHESEMLALDGSPTMLSAYLRWSEGVETYGDKSMCFKCWYDSSVSTKIGEKNEN